MPLLLFLTFYTSSFNPPQRELKITVKEVYEALDLESKKVQEVKNSNNQSLVTLSRIKNGIAKLSGERVPGTDSPSHSPSPSATSGPEIEDGATPGFPEQATAITREQGLADKENVRAMRSRDRKLSKNVRKLPPLCHSSLQLLLLQFFVYQ